MTSFGIQWRNRKREERFLKLLLILRQKKKKLFLGNFSSPHREESSLVTMLASDFTGAFLILILKFDLK